MIIVVGDERCLFLNYVGCSNLLLSSVLLFDWLLVMIIVVDDDRCLFLIFLGSTRSNLLLSLVILFD